MSRRQTKTPEQAARARLRKQRRAADAKRAATAQRAKQLAEKGHRT